MIYNPIPMSASESLLAMEAGRLRFKNPLLLASGCASFGEPFEDFFDISSVGAVISKAITPEPRAGNNPVRICETSSGMLNAIGLQNPGVEAFARDILPKMRAKNATVIVNVAGHRIEDYSLIVERLSGEEGIAGFELNLSCPNVIGGLVFGTDLTLFKQVCSRLRRETGLPLIPKLSPAAGDLVPYAKAAKQVGMDGVTVSNTHPGMAVDWRTGRSKLSRMSGGLSGPAVKPITLYNVWHVVHAVPDLPVIASGGAASSNDVIEFIRAGAIAVELGTMLFHNPQLPQKILAELPDMVKDSGVSSLMELRSTVSA
jgi:dihydroorotate dehydrogenase (NAD+) catalytic subunit